MLNSLVTLSLAIGASALVAPRSSGCCSFGLTASGGQSGTIGQLDDGQNRIGGNLTATNFCISNGGITDEAGRGCILTPSVEQFQCDQGVEPTYGFSIDNNGTLVSPSNSSVFYACPASETEWNLYTTPVIGQLKCVEISLTASSCGAETCTAAVQTVTVTATVTVDTCGVTSSSPVVATSVPYVSMSSVPAAPSSYTPSPESSAPVVSPTITPISVPATSLSEVSVPVVSSTVVVSSAPETTPSPIETTPYPTTYSETSTVVVSSVYTSSAVNSTATVVPVPQSSSIYIQSSTTPTITSTPIAPESTSTYIQPTTFLNSSTIAIPPSSATPTTLYTSTSTTASSTCTPTVLTGSSTSGNYQYPHLIVPVSSSSPSTAYGTSYFGNISSTTSTLFNFDIPSSYTGKTCNLIFLLPLQSQLETSSYTFSGSGEIDFLQLSSAASTSTSYSTVPSTEKDLGDFTVSEGSSTLVESFACPVGETLTYEMIAKADTSLYWFQDWNPSPLGLFITYC